MPFFSLNKVLTFIALPLLFLLSFIPELSAETDAKASVTGIKYWSNPNYTRIAISLDKKAGYSERLLKQDPTIKMEWRRLYIDIKNASLSKDLQKSIPINDGLLKAARAGQFDKDTVRVVLDIESIEDYKVFPLADPFRIIIDVTGERKDAAPEPPKEVLPVIKAPSRPEFRKETKTSLTQQLGLKVKTIVIDPGHGGKDPGAMSKRGLKEKDITLKIAKLLKEKLSSKLDSKMVLTRETDVFIPLEERTAIANSHDADLFVSIHVNASPRKAASGLETYTLNISNDEEGRRVAARENATSTRSVSDLEFILNDLIKTAKTNDSVRLATVVQDRLVARLRTNYRDIKSNGVKGAPFYVLIGTKMPSILVEVSFISNPYEEKRLRDEKYLREIVEGISSGIIEYINGQGSV